jgi:hypothetical protein
VLFFDFEKASPSQDNKIETGDVTQIGGHVNKKTSAGKSPYFS